MEVALDKFINNLDFDKWDSLSSEQRLAMLQDFENAMAELQGRDAIKVVAFSEEYANDPNHKSTLGYFSAGKNIIAINPKFLEGSKVSITGVKRFGLAGALETIAHEGRHAWQLYVQNHPEENLVDDESWLAFVMNEYGYISSSVSPYYYCGQLVEVDARRFAIESLSYIAKKLEEKNGSVPRELEVLVKNRIEYEKLVAEAILDNCSEEDIIKYEENLREMLEQLGLEFSEISIFTDVLELMKTRDIDAFAEGQSIRVRGGSFFTDAEKIDERPDSVDETKIKEPSFHESRGIKFN